MFAITFMGLSILTSLDSENILRTSISGILGLLLATVGQDPMYGVQRLTFGSNQLLSGIEMIPVLIGIFAITEVLQQTISDDRLTADDAEKAGASTIKTTMPTIKEWLSIKWVILRCSILGTIVGILPGAGATIASFLCYSTETKLSKYPEKFGTGIIDGVAASETATTRQQAAQWCLY
jgi:putative tricarboxylic transport membrane protein